MSEPIVVVREPGRSPLRLVLDQPLEVGRDCTGLLLTDAQISRRHLQLRVENGHVIATDLGSTNGTLIDGQPLTGPTQLGPGAVCTLGSTTVELVGIDPRSTMISGSPATTMPVDFRQTSIELVADSVTKAKPDLAVSADQGTVSIVFSDIESSTEQAARLGDERWFEVLGIHNDIVRRSVAAHGGTEIKSQGDGFMLTFPSARGAVRCMTAVQKDLADHSSASPADAVRIRVGVHTGEAIADADGDLFGRHVILAARIANEALGGEILVSSLVREIIEARGDVVFGDARTAELKGLDGSQTRYPSLWD